VYFDFKIMWSVEPIPDFCSKTSDSWKLLQSQASCCAVRDAAVANCFVRWQRRRDCQTERKLRLFAEMRNVVETQRLFLRGNIDWYFPWFLFEIFRSPRKFRHYLPDHHVCKQIWLPCFSVWFIAVKLNEGRSALEEKCSLMTFTAITIQQCCTLSEN
jgi:hypothetical protein